MSVKVVGASIGHFVMSLLHLWHSMEDRTNDAATTSSAIARGNRWDTSQYRVPWLQQDKGRSSQE